MKIHDYARAGDIEGIRREMERGESLEAPDDNGETPLMVALRSELTSVENIKSMIAMGAQVNATIQKSKWKESMSVLGVAVGDASIEKIEVLLAAGADINYVESNGYGIFLRAIFRTFRKKDNLRGTYPLLDKFIEYRVPLDFESIYGETALSIASNKIDFNLIMYLLVNGADPTPLMWNDLFLAVAADNLPLVKMLAEDETLLELQDRWDRTPFLMAIQHSSPAIAHFLLEAGSDILAKGRCGKTALLYAIERRHAGLLQWLIDMGCDVEEGDEFGSKPLNECLRDQNDVPLIRMLLAAGAKIVQQGSYETSTVSEASHPEIVKLLVAQGANLSDIGSWARRDLLGYSEQVPKDYSNPAYREHRHREFGSRNPERMNNPFWDVMIHSRSGAFHAAEELGYKGISANRPAVWCFSRYGQSLTALPDGRYVEIGGEHEDWYDADFCIYNDVVVHHGDGTFDIFGYPKEIFPPTDFHSATFVDRHIYVMGGLGYRGERTEGITPVFKLSIETFQIERVECSGTAPGWIYKHSAKLLDDQVIEITYGEVMRGEEWEKNDRVFHLNLKTKTWTVLPQ